MGTARAAVRLPHVLGDGMVLQQQSSARLWGWATPKRHGERHHLVEWGQGGDG